MADTCRLTTSLVPLASCTVTVTYTPTTVGLVSGSLLVFAVGNQGVQVTATFGANAVP